MKLTRRQFGLAVLGGIAGLLFGRILRLIDWRGGAAPAPSPHARARFWKRADHLAG